MSVIEILKVLNDKQSLKGDKTKNNLKPIIEMLLESLEGIDVRYSLEKKISDLREEYSKRK